MKYLYGFLFKIDRKFDFKGHISSSIDMIEVGVIRNEEMQHPPFKKSRYITLYNAGVTLMLGLYEIQA